MAYATVDDLAAALRVAPTSKNADLLQRCLDSSAQEIDHYCDRPTDDPIAPDDPLAGSVNVARGVEWFKAADAAFGGVGYADTGILPVKLDGFARHALALVPLKRRFGLA